MADTELTADEKAEMKRGRAQTMELMRKMQQGGALSMTPVDELPADKGNVVTMIVPKEFHLTLKDHTRVRFPAGVHQVPVTHNKEEIAEHWYVKAHGCEEYTPPKPKRTEDEKGKGKGGDK